MTGYKLLSRDNHLKLTEEVNAHIMDGWTVHGSPFVFGMHNTPACIYQAVVKDEPQIVETLGVPDALNSIAMDELRKAGNAEAPRLQIAQGPALDDSLNQGAK